VRTAFSLVTTALTNSLKAPSSALILGRNAAGDGGLSIAHYETHQSPTGFVEALHSSLITR
jgi:hypothetical protein